MEDLNMAAKTERRVKEKPTMTEMDGRCTSWQSGGALPFAGSHRKGGAPLDSGTDVMTV
jgi:hypothetical protein